MVELATTKGIYERKIKKFNKQNLAQFELAEKAKLTSMDTC